MTRIHPLCRLSLALALFFLHGLVELVPGLVLAVGNASGAWTASVLSVKKGVAWVRVFLVIAAFLASMKLLGVLDLLWDWGASLAQA